MIESKVTTVTPEMAKKWLELNTNNRKVKRSVVDKYAKDMLENKWFVTHQGLAFNGNNKLLDGQHRLLACVKANISFDTMVTTGLSESTKYGIDTQARRGFNDILSMQGIKSSTNLATIVKYLYLFDNVGNNKTIDIFSSKARKELNLQVLDNYFKTLDATYIHESYNYIYNLYGDLKFLTPTIGTFCYIVFYKISKHHAIDFIEKLYLGINLDSESPIILLRNKFIQMKAAKMMWRQDQIIGIVFKVWNCYRKQEPLKRIYAQSTIEKPI